MDNNPQFQSHLKLSQSADKLKNEQQNKKPVRIVVFGPTGAVGRQVVEFLRKDTQVEEVAIVTRRIVEKFQWVQSQFIPKLKVIVKESLDDISDLYNYLTGFNSYIICIGANPRKSKTEFDKVDRQYVTAIGELAQYLEVPYFSYISCYGANPKSFFRYQKIKGRAEEALKELGLTQLAIFRPYFLKNRKVESVNIWEKLRHYVPYFGGSSGIETTSLAFVMVQSAKELMDKSIEGLSIVHDYDQDVIENVLEMYSDPKLLAKFKMEFEEDLFDQDDYDYEEENKRIQELVNGGNQRIQEQKNTIKQKKNKDKIKGTSKIQHQEQSSQKKVNDEDMYEDVQYNYDINHSVRLDDDQADKEEQKDVVINVKDDEFEDYQQNDLHVMDQEDS